MFKAKNVGVRNAPRERSSNASAFECQSKQPEEAYFQTKTTELVQNKTIFIQVALKSLHFNVLYYSDICLVHYRMNSQQSG